MTPTDTIVAAATPPGPGWHRHRARLRAEGPADRRRVLGRAAAGAPRHLRALSRWRRASAIDAGLALFFPAPHSYTGEHVLELQATAARWCWRRWSRAPASSARGARSPGEFTQRAFLNDKLDLAQAEAIADLIDAGTREAARAAVRSLQGEFSAMVRALDRGGDRAAHLRRGGDRFSRGGDRLPRRPRAQPSASRRCATTSRACSTARARGACCARA